MRIITGKPPIYDRAKEVFDFNDDVVVFTYGDTLYQLKDHDLAPDLLAHEAMHSKQQGHTDEGAKEWWDKYFINPAFRRSQELGAYGVQFYYIRNTVKDRNKLTRMLYRLAFDLSSDQYKCDITHSDAMKLIKEWRP